MKQEVRLKGKLWGYIYGPIGLFILLLIMDVIAYTHVRSAFYMMLFFTIVYGLFEIGCFVQSFPQFSDEILNFAIRYASSSQKLLSELEVAYAILDGSGRIVWSNERFQEISKVSAGYRKSITTIYPCITRELIMKTDSSKETRVEKDGRVYRAHIKKVPFEDVEAAGGTIEVGRIDELFSVVYLFDETDLNMLQTEIKDQKMVSALVYIDNYDEVLDSVEDVKKSLMVALIDRKINQYFGRMDSLVRKMERDKYFVVFKYGYLEKMREDRFRILEDIKSVKLGNEQAVTLSIGIGVDKDNYNENYEMSRASIDLALARGGDQVVLKEGKDVTYFGGKAKEVEAKTRVKARVKAQALQEIIAGCENVLVMGHSLTDIDSLGAAIGVCCAARSLGKKAQIVINNPTSSIRPWVDDIFNEDKDYPEDLFIGSVHAREMVGHNTLVMVVDTNRPSYTECPELLRLTERVVVFDHHRQGGEAVENPILSYIEPYASSACEMVAEVLQYFNGGIRLNPVEADCLYAGILIDTNNFVTKTGVRTFEAAAFLRRSGADVTRVRKLLRNDMSAYKARASAVRDAEVFRNCFAISVCPSENVESPTVVGAQAANELLNIIGIKASFVLTEFNGKIFISSRSIDEINVQLIMERLGGGGHLNVAGAQLVGVTIDQAKARIRETIASMMDDGTI